MFVTLTCIRFERSLSPSLDKPAGRRPPLSHGCHGSTGTPPRDQATRTSRSSAKKCPTSHKSCWLRSCGAGGNPNNVRI